MAILTYSKKRDGATRLSTNFRVSEFACNDGSDTILIDAELVAVLQKIRNRFGKAVAINSGYRTAGYNTKIGGSPSSQHLNGKAADIKVTDIAPLQVAQYAESIGVGGIGHAPAGQGNYVHVDTRAVVSRWEYYNGGKSTKAISCFGGAPATSPAAPLATSPATPPSINTMITIETKSFSINGQEKRIRAELIGDENYVHLRDFVAAIDGDISYDDKTRLISIAL